MSEGIHEIVRREALRIYIERREGIYAEIIRINDFIENIRNSIETEEGSKQLKLEIATPVIDSLKQTEWVLENNYYEYLINDGNYDDKMISEIESAIRGTMVNTLSSFIRECKNKIEVKIGKFEDFGGGVVDMNQYVNDDILPTQEELTRGKGKESLEYLINSRVDFAKTIRACEQAFQHIFRLTYRLAMLDVGLVRNPRAIMWGRPYNEPVYLMMTELPRYRKAV